MQTAIIHKSKKQYQRGETLLEVLIALVVLIIGSVTATSLIITAIKANVYNKDSLVALNLAQEGLEFMRNVRDGNWIKFSADTQGCWNVKPGAATCSGNLLAEKLPSNNVGYALGDTLSNVGAKLDLSDGTSDEAFRIKYFDLTPAEDTDNWDRPPTTGDEKTDDYDFMGTSHTSGTTVTDTKFYRSINVDYMDIGTSPLWARTDVAGPSADMMIVTSTVQWRDGGITHQIKLSSALTRYK